MRQIFDLSVTFLAHPPTLRHQKTTKKVDENGSEEASLLWRQVYKLSLNCFLRMHEPKYLT